MAAVLFVSSLLNIFCLLLLLLQLQPLNAHYVVNEQFITKNGTRVKLSLIRRYLKYETNEQLSHMVFQLDFDTQKLVSYHRVIKVPNAPKTRIKESQFPDTDAYSKLKPLFQRKTPDGFFIFKGHKGRKKLVAAWGDTLDMHSLNNFNHPDIYINQFRAPQNSELSTDTISRRPKKPQCTKEYNLEFDVRFDKELCARYGNNFELTQTVLQLFMEESGRVIKDMTCVNVNTLVILGTCHRRRGLSDFDWSFLSTLNCTNTRTKAFGCDTISEHIMEKVKKNFRLDKEPDTHGFLLHVYRDMRLVFSGLQDAGSLAGITYRAQACSANHGYSWISGISRIALYHEVGHMLGANHDDLGIMRAKVRIGEDVLFSDRSKHEIARFVTADPRSWCLHRKLRTIEDTLNSDDWRPAITIPDIKHGEQGLIPKGMTLASLTDPSTAKRDLILGYYKRRGPGPPRRFLRVFTNILSSNGSLMLKKNAAQLIDIDPKLKPSKKTGFRIGFGHIANKSSNDLVLLHVAQKRFRSGTESYVPFYHVGFGMSKTIGPTHWTTALPIGDFSIKPAPKRWRRRDLWVGHVRTANGADIVYAELEKSDTGGSVASYQIGFNLSPVSGKPTEWSKQYRIPGEFPTRANSFSISVFDIDGNEKPDLIIYVQLVLRTRNSQNRHGISFIRVGKDLDDAGRVTNGWTRFKRVPFFYGTMGVGLIDTTSGMNASSPPVLIALTRDTVSSPLRTIQRFDANIPRRALYTHPFRQGRGADWKILERASSKPVFSISAGKTVLSPELMSTGRSESLIDALNEGCHRCYKSQGVPICISDVEHCRAQVDELNVPWSLPSEEEQTEPSLRASDLDFNNSLSEKRVSDNTEESIFCLGFHELRNKESGCDVVDVITVLGKGLEIALKDAVATTQLSPDDIQTRSMFEDPVATSGNGLPIIAQITIKKSESPTLKKAIREAERRMRNQYPSFQSVFNRNKVGREEKSWRRKWTIKYFMKSGFTNDAIF